MIQPMTSHATRLRAFVLLSLLVTGLLGCRARAPEPEPRPSPTPVHELGILDLVNHSQGSVFHVRWRNLESEQWSGDQLDTGDVLAPGQERTFELVPGRYALRLELGDGTDWSPTRPLDVVAGARARCVLPGEPQAKLGKLTVANDSPWAIVDVRFSLRSEPSLGPERLAKSEYVLARQRRSWAVAPGHYQLQVAFPDGQKQQSEAYEVKAGAETVFRIGGE